MGIVPTVEVEKDGQLVTVNASDIKDWEAKGWKAKGSKPKADAPEVKDGFCAVMREAGEWDVVMFVDGKESAEAINEAPLKKGKAVELAKSANEGG